MNITVNLKKGMVFGRGNDFVELVQENGEKSFVVHYYDINYKYTGSGYMIVSEIEKWININGFQFSAGINFYDN